MKSIKIKNLNYEISGIKILEDINFNIYKEKISGLIGTSGSGKTTLLHILLGLIKQSSGEIIYEGLEKKYFPKNKLQAIFQDPISYFNPNFTLKEILLEPLEIYFKNEFDKKWNLALEYLDYFSISKSSLNQNIKNFSGGEIQRISFIRILLIEPEWILMDEPISGLDPIRRKDSISLIKKIHQEKKISFFIISHDLDFISEISDFVFVMQKGKIIEEGDKNLFQNPKTNFVKELKNSRNLENLKKV